jgi:hypothetical protein
MSNYPISNIFMLRFTTEQRLPKIDFSGAEASWNDLDEARKKPSQINANGVPHWVRRGEDEKARTSRTISALATVQTLQHNVNALIYPESTWISKPLLRQSGTRTGFASKRRPRS